MVEKKYGRLDIVRIFPPSSPQHPTPSLTCR
jgi:hypothetical protein